MTETRPISEIKTSDEYRDIIKRQSVEEKARLVKSITDRGIEKPLEIGSVSGYLVDGYERLEAAKEAGLDEVPVIIREFETEEDEKKYVVLDNLFRRNLPAWWVSKLLLLWEELGGTSENLGIDDEEEEDSGVVIEHPQDGKAMKKAPKQKKRTGGASKRSQDQVKRILKHGDEEMIRQLDRGEISAQRADKMIRDKEASEKPVQSIPDGKWNCIVEDPWAPGGGPYRQLDDDEITDLDVGEKAADNSLYFLWVPQERMLRTDKLSGPALVKSRGFEPITVITVTYTGTDKWTGGIADYLIIARRGKVEPFGLGGTTTIDVGGPRTKHRPDSVWEYIERCIETQKWEMVRMDMRGMQKREGWDTPQSK